MRRRPWVLLLAIAAAGLGVAAFADEASRGLQRVLVENFPQVQRVEGKMTFDAPFPQARFVPLEATLVTTAQPDNTNRLIAGGTLETTGFSEVTLSLTAQTKGDMPRPGRIGALLVPDVEPVADAFADQGTVQFPLEVAANVTPGSAVFLASNQPRYAIAFPRYRVYYFNTTEKAVTVNLYAYMTQ